MTHEELIQYSTEVDVLGTMLIKESISKALLRNVIAKDFKFAQNREIYSYLRDMSDRRGKIEIKTILSSNIKRNKHILNLMNDCLTTNLDVKCKWLTEDKQ